MKAYVVNSPLLLCTVFLLNLTINIHSLEVDVYQNMESGNPGNLLTSSIMNASSHGGFDIEAKWRFKAGSKMWVSNENCFQIPGTIIVDGKNYNTASTRSWRFRNREEQEYVVVEFKENAKNGFFDRITVACYYTTDQYAKFSNQHDNIELHGSKSYGVLQTVGHTGKNPPYIRAHSCKEGWSTTFSPEVIKIIPGKTYWVNLHLDGISGKCKVAVFDPENGYSLVGDTAISQSVKGTKIQAYTHFGRCSVHGDEPNNETSAFFDHILIDYTNAAFPLLPDINGEDNTPPIISNVKASVTSTRGNIVTITWNTNEPANSQVEYGLTKSYGTFTDIDKKLVTEHTQQITGLKENTLYYFRVHSRDGSENKAVSGENSVKTASGNTSTYYWVSPNGKASWNNAKSSTPLDGSAACNLKTANTNAQPGDIIYLRKGKYNSGDYIKPKNSGVSENARITFSNYKDEKVIIKDASYGILLDSKSYITVNGINFYYLDHFLFIKNNSNHNSIGYCIFDQTRTPDKWEGSQIYHSSQYNKVHHCVFSRFGKGRDHGSLLDIGSVNGKNDKSFYNLIENNILFYGGHHCLAAWSKFCVFRNNYLHHEKSKDGKYGYRCAISHGMEGETGSNLFEGNRIAFAYEASGMALRSPKNIFRFNSFYKNNRGGMQIVTDWNKGHARADNNYIYNNVFYNNGYNSASKNKSGGIYFANWGRGDPKNNIIKNNIFYKNKGGPITHDGVIKEPQIFVTNWITGDPLFVDDESSLDPFNPSLPNFNLQEESQCIDKGSFLTKITSRNGSGTSFKVKDAGYFIDGWGIIEGDEIQFEGTAQKARIRNIDYTNNTITVDKTVIWSQNMGVSLVYVGSAPDIGAFEYSGDYGSYINDPINLKNDPNLKLCVYPNPSKGKFHILLNNSASTKISENILRIYDISGRLIDEITSKNGQFIWNNISVSTGTYFLRLNNAKEYLKHRLFLFR